ncbi:hypothetical protein ACTD5D_40335 [Nocardia takedensis]|uniref:hypothetical protein n=1 Tax=Nocardia takedensis TaxID=259390 RepID=UPI003F762F98
MYRKHFRLLRRRPARVRGADAHLFRIGRPTIALGRAGTLVDHAGETLQADRVDGYFRLSIINGDDGSHQCIDLDREQLSELIAAGRRWLRAPAAHHRYGDGE